MPENEGFDEIIAQAQVYLGDNSTLQNAYDLLTEAAPRFPENAAMFYNNRYCAAALMNKNDLALHIIQESLDAGFFWSAAYLTSEEDLKSLRDLPEFKRVTETSNTKYLDAQKNSKPLALELPLPENAETPLPLLLALHGNYSNVQRSVEFWESAVQQGWRTALLQSSQIFNLDAYVWDDLEKGAAEIKSQFQDLTASDSPDAGPTVVGGFSKGGELAIWLVLKEIIPSAGFISVNPYITNVEMFLPLLEACNSRNKLRGWFVAGEKDPNLDKIKALHEMFNAHGLECQLTIAPDIGHDFPADFNQTLAQALNSMFSVERT